MFAILSVSKRKGIIETKATVESFWYQRALAVNIFISTVIGILWLINYAGLRGNGVSSLAVSLYAACALGAVLLISILTFIIRPLQVKPVMMILTLISAASTLLCVQSTGDFSSPYLAIWVVAALLSTLTGVLSLLGILAIVGAYGISLYASASLDPAGLVAFVLLFILPVLLGYVTWRRRFKTLDNSTQKVSELAHELSQESSKTEIIINAIADGVLLLDAKGIIQLINPAAERIIGWGNEEATELDYRSVLKIIDNKDDIISGDNDPVQRCLITNESVITDKLGIRTVSGKQLLASIMASPLEQTGSGAIVVFRDITDQRAEEREQAEFISTASHEMRTPVAAIEGYIGLALNPQTAVIDDKARLYLSKAQVSAKHLGRLFQDLLDISKLEDGRLGSNPKIIEVIAYVRSLLDEFNPQFAEKNLQLTYTPDSSASSTQTLTPIYYAKADTDHLHEVLSNLVTNAIKYTKEGVVTVDVTGDKEHIFISVKDTGLGIPAEDIPHLFQKFYRVDNSETREIGGTGLGLYLSRHLAENMGGHLNVTSTYGSGSTFTIDLPRVTPEDYRAQSEQSDDKEL